MKNASIILKSKYYNKAEQILICFEYNKSIIDLVRTIPGRKWSYNLHAWYVKHSSETLQTILEVFNNYTVDDSEVTNTSILKPKHNTSLLNKEQRSVLNGFYTYLKGKRYSKSTIKTYVMHVTDFVAYYRSKVFVDFTNRDVELYIESVFVQRNYSISTHRQFVSALKLFIIFEPSTQISGLELTRPNKSRKLPVVLSQEEILRLLQYTKNLKHRMIIALLYSCGLRISELLHLRLSDIDLNRRQLYIHDGKGRKDRYVGLAEICLPLVSNYVNTYMPKLYFIEGKNDQIYSAESVRAFLKRNCKSAGIIKRVTPHTLRHSYVTHLLENGVDIRYIQSLLGHSRPETTMIYTHIKRQDLLKISNPLDVAVQKLYQADNDKSNIGLSRENYI